MFIFLKNECFLFLHQLGGVFLFTVEILRIFFTTRHNSKNILAQVLLVFSHSLPTVVFAGAFVGAILVLQFHLILAKFNAESLLGGLNTSTIIREVGPLIISFLLAGKIGAYTAAELGTMRITEQIDAIECLGTHPIQYLVVPRFMGIVISSILLLVVGLIVSVLGAMIIASVFCNMNYLEFAASIPRFSSLWTIFGGVFKSTAYGVIVASVACYQGFTAKGGARGVGRAVTSAAVYTNFYILLTNFCSTYFLEFIEEVAHTFFARGPYEW